MQKPCIVCGLIIDKSNSRCSQKQWEAKKYCSWNCSYKAKTGKRPAISTEFQKGHLAPRTAFKKGLVPWNKKPNIFITCISCKVLVKAKPYEAKRKKFCSLACHGRYKLTKQDGHLTKLNQRIRTSNKYREWRTAVYKRDRYICQMCGQLGGQLHVDHIKRFAIIVSENKIQSIKDALSCKELWSLKNGRTLCVPCHKQTPTYCEGSGNPNFIKN